MSVEVAGKAIVREPELDYETFATLHDRHTSDLNYATERNDIHGIISATDQRDVLTALNPGRTEELMAAESAVINAYESTEQ